MRTQDGQPRGFGYVTLDSAIAAQRCLAEPQLIDNRVVDMKSAVPEGSGCSPTGAAGFRKGGSGNMGMDMFAGYNYNEWSAPYGNGHAWWPGQESAQTLDCLDLLNASRVSSPHGLALHPGYSFCHQDQAEVVADQSLDAMGLLLPPVLSSEQKSAPLHADFQQLSANAPEFVPASMPNSPTAPPGNLTSMKNPRQVSSRTRAPLGELTNIVQAGDLLKPFASPSKKKDMGSGHLSAQNIANQAESPLAAKVEIAGVSKQSVAQPTGLIVHDEGLEDTTPKKDCDSPASLAETKAEDSPALEVSKEEDDHSSKSSDESEDEEEVDMNNLPSLGSATHNVGECKRCNFFAKGRCQNGKDCSFCHFPHEKRKPSRQEKRERRAEWLGQQGGEDSMTSESSPTSIRAGVKKVPPAPLDMTGLGYTAPPPGLAPWQPEIEANPFSFMTMGQTMPGMFDPYAFQNFASSASSPMSSALLSTVPSLAATPFQTPSATPTNGGAHVMLPGGMSTSGTQTGNFMCRRCVVEGKSMESESVQEVADKPEVSTTGHQWARDELLRLRDGLMKMPKADMAARSIPIRSAPIAECGVF